MDNKPISCSVDGCDKLRDSKGLCDTHYRRFRKYGDPLIGAAPTKQGDVREFFHSVVSTYEGNDCLIWPYARSSAGYGKMKRNGKMREVHRLICEDAHGPAPTPEHEAAHSCGKGHLACVTKGHLSWKTAKGNSEDRVTHGTSNQGEKNAHSKLTEAQVREILSLRGKEPRRETATRFGVSTSAIGDIQNGKSWACLSEGREG